MRERLRSIPPSQAAALLRGQGDAASLPADPRLLASTGYAAATERLKVRRGNRPAMEPTATGSSDSLKRSAGTQPTGTGATTPASLDGLLLVAEMDEGRLPALVTNLDACHALDQLLAQVPEDPPAVQALPLLRILEHARKDGRERLRERAIRAVELRGEDPDERLGTYSKKRDSRVSYSEELAEQDSDGTWRMNTYSGDRAYTLGITPNEVIVTVRIRLHPDVSAGDPETLKARWHDGITSVWNGKYRVANGRRSLPLRFRPLFIPVEESRASHHEVRVIPGPSHSNETRWDTEDEGQTTAAHEFGHMVGARDEYSLPLKDDQDQVLGSYDETDSIMSGDYGRVQCRHLDAIREDLNRMRGPREPEFRLEPM